MFEPHIITEPAWSDPTTAGSYPAFRINCKQENQTLGIPKISFLQTFPSPSVAALLLRTIAAGSYA